MKTKEQIQDKYIELQEVVQELLKFYVSLSQPGLDNNSVKDNILRQINFNQSQMSMLFWVLVE